MPWLCQVGRDLHETMSTVALAGPSPAPQHTVLLSGCPSCSWALRTQCPCLGTGATLTFALEQEEVGAVAEGGAEVGAVLNQVTGQALPVEVAHCVGAARAETW